MGAFFLGGGVGFKTEHRHRGMKLGIAPHSPDYWGRQLAAGGPSRAQNLNLRLRKNAFAHFGANSSLFASKNAKVLLHIEMIYQNKQEMHKASPACFGGNELV